MGFSHNLSSRQRVFVGSNRSGQGFLRRLACGEREPDPKIRALPDITLDRDRPAVFADDLMHHSQAQTAAAPPGFSRKERIEDAILDLLADALTRVTASDVRLS